MGRLHLSASYDVDAPRPRVLVPQLPKYVDAPFDLDATHSDAVYEAFLTPQQIRERENNPIVPVVSLEEEQERTASPVESLDISVESESVVSAGEATLDHSGTAEGFATQTGSHPMEAWLGRYGLFEVNLDTSFVSDLVRRIDAAIDNAIPAINAALQAEGEDCLGRLEAVLNPHIDAALVGLEDSSVAENVARLLQRSWIVETLGLSLQLPCLRSFRERELSLHRVPASGDASMIDSRTEEDEEDGELDDDAASDPGFDEEDQPSLEIADFVESHLHSHLAPPSPLIRPSITPPPTGVHVDLSHWWYPRGEENHGRVSPFLQSSRAASPDSHAMEIDPGSTTSSTEDPSNLTSMEDDDARSSGSSSESSSPTPPADFSPSPIMQRLQPVHSATEGSHVHHFIDLPAPHRNYYVVASH